MSSIHVLLIEDDPDGRESVKEAIEDIGYDVSDVETGQEGVNLAADKSFDVILSDLVLPDIDGLEVLERVGRAGSDVPFIIMTAYGTVSTAVQALKAGAFDYITKPLDLDDIQAKVKKAAEMRQLRTKVADLQESVKNKYSSDSIIAADPKMLDIIEQVRTLADTDATVLIQGESGTGKEVVARALHVDGKRKEGPFVAVNCGAFTESLLESELFGHEKGAFTGANAQRKGAFERAEKGTLFLDEIGNAPVSVQVKLLRVLEEREFMRVGGEKVIKADVRVISAANRVLDDLVADGDFREDLMYRLKVVTLRLPPLRERPGDIRPLVDYFLAQAVSEHGRRMVNVDESAYTRLEGHNWPGNVRELRNVVESSLIMLKGDSLTERDITLHDRDPVADTSFSIPDGMTFDEIEREILLQVLKRNKGNRTIASEELGISRRTIQRKIKEYDLPY
ncbi:hypothetical protein BVX97_05360 [bacterium E08(2017)]|nr:hypothetical protein BVX97_05360 [bacterium E08(2017)]